MKEQEGPRIGLTRPTYYKTCVGCKYHQSTLFKSGRDPIYNHKCTHPTVSGRKYPYNSDLHEDENGNVEPGDWCPFEPVNAIDIP
jgi:hypothetical protein